MSAVQVVPLEGYVDIPRAATLLDELRQSVANQDLGLVVDLTDVRYLDSAGVNVLFELGENLADRQLGFAVVVPEGGVVERVVELVNLAAVADLHRTPAAAEAALRA